MIRRFRAGAAGLLLSLVIAAPAAAAPTVTVRVEGEAGTLLPRTPVTLLDSTEPNTTCPGTSAAAAIELATKGDWDRKNYFQRLLGEVHDYSQDSDYWGVWVFRGGRYVVANGVCDELLAEGEELLAAYQQAPPPDYQPVHLPLWITGLPATVRAGEPFTVTVYETQCEQFCAPGEGRPVAREGATVTAGDASAVTGADGRATLVLTRTGEVAVRATRDPNTPSAVVRTCVTAGDDGLCGTAQPAPPCVHDGDDGRCGTRDLRAPQARIAGIAEQERFRRRSAPRELSGTVEADPSGLRHVKLSLTRRASGRCWAFSSRRERFRRVRCGQRWYFSIGEKADWSYLLPSRLPRGRYVLDAVAVDRAGNRDALARGRNRVVFHVR